MSHLVLYCSPRNISGAIVIGVPRFEVIELCRVVNVPKSHSFKQRNWSKMDGKESEDGQSEPYEQAEQQVVEVEDSSQLGTEMSSPAFQEVNSSRSSAREGMNSTAIISDDGCLDLSEQDLVRLNKQFKEEYRNAKKLDLRSNRFKMLSGMDMFRHLTELDASQNELVKLTSLLPLSGRLTRLTLNNNKIADVKDLGHFPALQHVSLRNNQIESLPSLSSKQLQYLELADNLIEVPPNVFNCTNLQYLGLSRNQIASLENAKTSLPRNLKSLALDVNQIADLTQFVCLEGIKLVELSVETNPCFLIDAPFNYRPFFACLLTESLEVLDKMVLSEEEQLKGEFLLIQGKIRKLKIGQHKELHDYLTSVCPLSTSTRLSDVLNESVQKALQARTDVFRGHNSSMSVSDLDMDENSSKASENVSLYSPYSNWRAQLNPTHRLIAEKENQTPATRSRSSSLGSPLVKSAKSSPRSPFKPSPQNSRYLRRTSTMDSTQSEASTSTVIISSTNTIRPSSQETIPTISSAQLPGTVLFDEDFEEPDNAQRQTTLRVIPVVRDKTWGKSHGVEDQLREEIRVLREEVRTLKIEHEKNVEINESTAMIIDHLVKSMEELRNEVQINRPVMPIPLKLRAKPSGTSPGIFEISWTMPVVSCYNAIVDGRMLGPVQALDNSFIIQDLTAGIHNIQIQASFPSPVGLNGEVGGVSEPITIEVEQIAEEEEEDKMSSNNGETD
ncbi:hypothetical protein WR25_21058 [Diploscapter pachys]|uniref:Fibronectin type-III domain-containing protein n=1 Tax=Diploscapter pachys TaxID=2018661 RepID=A0A2A2KRX2_9BILA|nr:hypothetical protein WR25_21058 [Diploscapter pachys]